MDSTGAIQDKETDSKELKYIFYAALVIFLLYWSARCANYSIVHPDIPRGFALFNCLTDGKYFNLSFNKVTGQMFFALGLTATLVIMAYDTVKITNAHFKDGEQYGRSQFMTKEKIKIYNKTFTEPYGQPYAEGNENTIISKHCCLSMNTDHTRLNNNIMIVGGPGSGKSFNIVRPNLLQAYGSYVVTDPSGELLATTGKFFEQQGYEIRVFNLVTLSNSHRYNPFNYINGEDDVMALVEVFMKNTAGDKKGGDQFWDDSMKALLEAIIFYLIDHESYDKQNFSTISKMLREAKTDPKTMMSQLDAVFDKLRLTNPDELCLKQWDIFKQAPDKTAGSILITAAVRFAPFNIDSVSNLTCADDMELRKLGDRPTIIYIIVPQGNNPYAFLINMMYAQMFDSLYQHAAVDCNGRLKYDVRFVLDEFANIGVIPGFQQKLTTMRKYGMSCMIFIQAESQLKNLYKEDWETLIGACDTYIYLGGNETSTMEGLVKRMGEQTIRIRNTGTSKSAKGGGSDSKNFQYNKRQLMTVGEVRTLKPGYLIATIKGVDVFYDEKYKTTDHPNAKYLGNNRTGERLYHFTYCNTRPKAIKNLIEQTKKEQDAKIASVENSRRPSDKVYQNNYIQPELARPEITTEEAKKLYDKLESINIGIKESLMSGAEVTVVKSNKESTTYTTKNNNHTVQDAMSMQSTVNSMMDDLNDL